MDKIRGYSLLYGLTYKRRWLPMRLIIPFMNFIERKANTHLEEKKEYYINKSWKPERTIDNVIVSLTSFPARIEYVWKTIVSIKAQSYLPEKIILWLSKEEFENMELPQELKKLQDNVFEIRFVEGNLRSHKKYYYAFQEFPNSTIITLDDDTFYHENLLKSLIEKNEKFPNAIIANWVIKIRQEGNVLMPYTSWKEARFNKKEKNLFPIGVSGVLYPPHSLPELIKDKEAFMELAPLADDVWLNAMSRLKGTKVIYSGWKYRNIPVASHTISLTNENCGNNMNDVQINNVREYIKEHFNKDVYIDI